MREVGSNQTMNPPGSVGSQQWWRQHSGILLALRTVVHHHCIVLTAVCTTSYFKPKHVPVVHCDVYYTNVIS